MPEPLPALILIVDDEEAACYAIGQILQKAGYLVWHCGSAAEALRLAAEGPQLLLAKADLPDLPGPELAPRLKSNPAGADLPVLLLADAEAADALLDAADGVLTRPVRLGGPRHGGPRSAQTAARGTVGPRNRGTLPPDHGDHPAGLLDRRRGRSPVAVRQPRV